MGGNAPDRARPARRLVQRREGGVQGPRGYLRGELQSDHGDGGGAGGEREEQRRGARSSKTRVARRPPRSARARLSSAPVDAHARSRVARAIIVRPRPPRDPQIRARPSAPDASPPSAPDSPAPMSPPPGPRPLQLAAHLESLIECARAPPRPPREPQLPGPAVRVHHRAHRSATGLDAPEDAQQLSRRVAQSPSYANLDPSPDAARATFRDAVAAARRRHAGAPDDGEDADVIVTQAGGRGGASSGSGVPGPTRPTPSARSRSARSRTSPTRSRIRPGRVRPLGDRAVHQRAGEAARAGRACGAPSRGRRTSSGSRSWRPRRICCAQ